MAEPRECFTYLAKNIQPWIKEVEKLELQMGEGVTAVTEVAVLANSNPKDDGLAPPYRESQPEVLPKISDYPPQNRKATSTTSTYPREHKHRARSTIVVYYNSEVQDAFNRLVHYISKGRNIIRKSYETDRRAAIMQMQTWVYETQSIDASLPHGDYSVNIPRPLYRKHVDSRSRVGSREQVDKALCRAQELCEKGAHQALKDGCCREQTAALRDIFKDILMIATKEAKGSEKEI